jgi:hypothetical protein
MRDLTFEEIDLVSGGSYAGLAAGILATVSGALAVVAVVATFTPGAEPVAVVSGALSGIAAVGAGILTIIDNQPVAPSASGPLGDAGGGSEKAALIFQEY